MMKPTTKLRELLKRDEALMAPGAFDPMAAKLVERAGFEAVYMTGAGVSHSSLGMPDLGLLTFTEMVDRADVIFHLAAAGGVKLIGERPVHTIETNVHGTEVVLKHAEVRFVRGRLKFGRGCNDADRTWTSAPFASVVLVFRPARA